MISKEVAANLSAMADMCMHISNHKRTRGCMYILFVPSIAIIIDTLEIHPNQASISTIIPNAA